MNFLGLLTLDTVVVAVGWEELKSFDPASLWSGFERNNTDDHHPQETDQNNFLEYLYPPNQLNASIDKFKDWIRTSWKKDINDTWSAIRTSPILPLILQPFQKSVDGKISEQPTKTTPPLNTSSDKPNTHDLKSIKVNYALTLPSPELLQNLLCQPRISFLSCLNHCVDLLGPSSDSSDMTGFFVPMPTAKPRSSMWLSLTNSLSSTKSFSEAINEFDKLSADKSVFENTTVDNSKKNAGLTPARASQLRTCILAVCVNDYLITPTPGCLGSNGELVMPGAKREPSSRADFATLDFYNPKKLDLYSSFGYFEFARRFKNIMPSGSGSIYRTATILLMLLFGTVLLPFIAYHLLWNQYFDYSVVSNGFNLQSDSMFVERFIQTLSQLGDALASIAGDAFIQINERINGGLTEAGILMGMAPSPKATYEMAINPASKYDNI